MRVTVAVAILGVILVGCDAAAASSVPTTASSTTTQAIASPKASSSSIPLAVATPLPTARPTPAAPPALPKAVTITRKGCYTGPEGWEVPPGTCTTTLTWEKVSTEGTAVEAYGVTACLSRTDRAGNGSCLEPNTVVPASVRKLIASAPASNGKVSWTGPAWLDNVVVDTRVPQSDAIGVDRHGDELYFAIIVLAANEAGRSEFVIADAGSWCYDTGCAGP